MRTNAVTVGIAGHRLLINTVGPLETLESGLVSMVPRSTEGMRGCGPGVLGKRTTQKAEPERN